MNAVGTLEFMAPELLKLPALPQKELERLKRDCGSGARYTDKARPLHPRTTPVTG